MTEENLSRIQLESPVHGPIVAEEVGRLRKVLEEHATKTAKAMESEYARGSSEHLDRANGLALRLMRLVMAIEDAAKKVCPLCRQGVALCGPKGKYLHETTGPDQCKAEALWLARDDARAH